MTLTTERLRPLCYILNWVGVGFLYGCRPADHSDPLYKNMSFLITDLICRTTIHFSYSRVSETYQSLRDISAWCISPILPQVSRTLKDVPPSPRRPYQSWKWRNPKWKKSLSSCKLNKKRSVAVEHEFFCSQTNPENALRGLLLWRNFAIKMHIRAFYEAVEFSERIMVGPLST